MEEYIREIISMIIDYAPKVLGALATLIIGFWTTGKISNIICHRMQKSNVDQGVVSFVSGLINILLKALVLLSAISMFGLQITSFIAVISASAFALGIALQGNLSHMASGIFILIFRPFKVGDFIISQGHSGTVKAIQLFSTIITTFDNRVVIIPNNTLTSSPIENLSANDMRKVPMTFGIGYNDDIDKAKQLILDVAASCDKVDHTLPVDIFVAELGDSSVNFSVRPWCKTSDYWAVHFYMQENVKKSFDQAGVSIPFPQMDVHVNNMDN